MSVKQTYPHLYNSWRGMRNRCMSKNRVDAHCYAAKGITVCDEWNDVDRFKDWAFANGWEIGLTIDRIDGNKGYSPDNCRWVDRKIQARNLNKNRNIEFDGKTMCLSAWAENLGISPTLLYARIMRLKWPLALALTTPVGVIPTGPKRRTA